MTAKGCLQRIRESLASLWGGLGGFWGIPPATARVHGWLLACPGGASAEDLMRALGMSRGAVSMACRELRDWGLVRAERGVGGRRITYRPEEDLEKVVRNVVAARKRREWDPMRERLREWIAELESGGGAEAREVSERLRIVAGVVEAIDGMAEAFLRGGLIQRFGLRWIIGRAKRKGGRR